MTPATLDAMEASAHRSVTAFFRRARAQGADSKVVVAHRAGFQPDTKRLNGTETLELHLNGGARDGEV